MDAKTKARWDPFLTSVLVGCALLTTGLVLHRELLPQTAAPSVPQKPVFVDDWRSHLHRRLRLGQSDAPVQLIQFADFECPYCALFHETLESVRRRYPTEIGVTYAHYPIQGHRFAEPPARAVECAGEQGQIRANARAFV